MAKNVEGQRRNTGKTNKYSYVTRMACLMLSGASVPVQQRYMKDAAGKRAHDILVCRGTKRPQTQKMKLWNLQDQK